MTINKRIVIAIIFIILLAGGAYLLEWLVKVHGTQSGSLIPIVDNNNIVAYFDADIIRQLSDSEANGEGVSLNRMLSAAGVINYNKVEITELDKSESYSFSREDTVYIKLNVNENNTITMINKTVSDSPLIEKVGIIELTN